MLKKVIQCAEACVKSLLFDCHQCGQCVLSQTGLVCPMSCPKGLRNGPCGGTIDGRCEVYPDRPCVHVRIHERVAHGSTDLPPLLPAPDASLFRTSSYLNHLSGADKPARTPLPYLDLGTQRVEQPCHTASALEAALRSGRFVATAEGRAPRGADWAKFTEHALTLRGHFDAVNATAFLNGRPSLPSPLAAAQLVGLGIEPIAQATCRDHTRTSFISELMQLELSGVHNLLCLTGDAFVGTPRIRQVFDLDSALMLYEARFLRETGTIHFTDQALATPPKLFLGAACNPFTTPENVPIRRLKQKIAAGADFVQTQLICDVDAFERFMTHLCAEGLNREVFVVAGVPVVVSAKALEMLPGIPGVKVPEEMLRRLRESRDIRAAGVALAVETVQRLSAMPGVAGTHLMLFGADHSALVEVRAATAVQAARIPA